ncbi:MFS transporter [Actinomadura sp. B10D3]|uniref:MFS transporter n=1 Tax=Actinomadura sp. B10D3 TaxID=3153557 RepID=UPI00325E216F
MAAAASGMSLPSEGAAADHILPPSIWLRNYRLLLSGSVLSQLGTLGAAAANPLLALALTGSPIVAGWVAAANTLPGLVLHLPAGLLADRYDRRWIMAISQGVRLINSAILICCLIFLPAPWAIFVVAAVIDGSCAVFFRIAELAAVRHVVPDGEAENRMGKSEARHHLALVLGRPVGGLLFACGRQLPYLLDALTTCISLISIAFLKGDLKSDPTLGDASRTSKGKALSSLREGLNHIFRDRLLFVSFGACAVANAGFQIVILLLVVEAERQDFTGTIIGAMLATSGLSGFLGAISAPMVVRRFRPVVTIKCCVLLWFPFILVVAIADDPRVGLGAWGACSFMGAYINVALAMHQSKVIPKGVLGRVEGITQFLTTGAVALGASVGGYVISCFGSRTTAVLVAGAFLAITVVVFLLAHPPAHARVAAVGVLDGAAVGALDGALDGAAAVGLDGAAVGAPDDAATAAPDEAVSTARSDAVTGAKHDAVTGKRVPVGSAASVSGKA